MVEVTGLEPAASSSQNWRATSCATPRNQYLILYAIALLIYCRFGNSPYGAPKLTASCATPRYSDIRFQITDRRYQIITAKVIIYYVVFIVK